jgi:hypothetical protein
VKASFGNIRYFDFNRAPFKFAPDRNGSFAEHVIKGLKGNPVKAGAVPATVIRVLLLTIKFKPLMARFAPMGRRQQVGEPGDLPRDPESKLSGERLMM